MGMGLCYVCGIQCESHWMPNACEKCAVYRSVNCRVCGEEMELDYDEHDDICLKCYWQYKCKGCKKSFYIDDLSEDNCLCKECEDALP